MFTSRIPRTLIALITTTVVLGLSLIIGCDTGSQTDADTSATTSAEATPPVSIVEATPDVRQRAPEGAVLHVDEASATASLIKARSHFQRSFDGRPTEFLSRDMEFLFDDTAVSVAYEITFDLEGAHKYVLGRGKTEAGHCMRVARSLVPIEGGYMKLGPTTHSCNGNTVDPCSNCLFRCSDNTNSDNCPASTSIIGCKCSSGGTCAHKITQVSEG
jgi:hypothetical protein